VELNKTIVRKREWCNAAVPPGAKLEIVEFVGGG
jgi:thiamine biosynthesis protein ThiS